MRCPHIEYLESDVEVDQSPTPVAQTRIGPYCGHPQAPKVDQPMRAEEAAKCENRGDSPCWRGLPG